MADETNMNEEARADLLSRIRGERRKVGSNNPIVMDDPSRMWLVLDGHVDLFATRFVDDVPADVGRHLMRIEHGEVMFGIPSVDLGGEDGGGRLVVLAVACMGSELFEAERADLEREDFDIVTVDWVDRWVARLAATLAGGRGCRADVLLEAEPDQSYRKGKRLSAQRDDVVWMRIEKGTLRYLGRDELPVEAGEAPFPVTDRTWLTVSRLVKFDVRYTPTLLFQGDLWIGLDAFHRLFLPAVLTDLRAAGTEAGMMSASRLRASALAFRDGLRRLAGVLDESVAGLPAADEVEADPLHAACGLIAERLGLRLARDAGRGAPTVDEALRRLARRSRIGFRRVRLEPGWFRRDGGPLVGFLADGDEAGRPVALLPVGVSAYELVDGGRRVRVDAATAATLADDAYILNRPFPDRPIGVRDVLRFGARGLSRDFTVLLSVGLAAGLLALAMPMLTGTLFSEVIPRSDMDTHLAIVGALIAAALGSAAFETVRGMAMLRIQGRMEQSIQGAVWERLIRLPADFFRKNSTGDLADRAGGITAIRDILTGAVTGVVLDAVFSLTSLVLLFVYSWRLALVAVGLAAVSVLATVGLTVPQLTRQRAIMRRMGRVEGLVLQMIAAVTKLRNSGGEPRMFARWARETAERNTLTLSLRRIAAVQRTLTQVFPILATMVVFAAVMKLGPSSSDGTTTPLVGMGAFLSFNSAFGQFVGALMSMTGQLTTMVAIVPLYERVDPILKAEPEVPEDADDPGELTGDIEFRHVTFRYDPRQPPVVRDLSWHVRSGEYVTFVGPSGGGKSTIIRLLLGFERPESGGIYLDGKELFGLDLAAVRGRIGVVLQNGRLMSGSLFDNIVGSTPATMDDAWEAARLAGMEADIRAMPMAMRTVLSEGASTLSGGQRQRLMIARALIHKPRVLVLDEATSALDNQTQSIVNQSLDRLSMTRIVVAHRLSTIRNVHRVLVLRDGVVVETGTFDELLARNGAFAELARRQLT